MNLHLYEIADQYREISDAIEQSDGELTPELERAWDAIQAPLQEKLDAVAAIVRSKEAKELAHKKEAAHQNKKASVAGNAAKNLKEYAKRSMETAGIKQSNGRFDLRIQANPMRARWNGDPDQIPEPFCRTETIKTFLPNAVLAAHKRGEDLPEGILVTQGSHLRIS